jgi:hypothetical protein
METGEIECTSAQEIMVSCCRCGFVEIFAAGSHYCQQMMRLGRHLCLNCNTFQALETKDLFPLGRGAGKITLPSPGPKHHQPLR